MTTEQFNQLEEIEREVADHHNYAEQERRQYEDRNQILIEALEQIEQMSDPGSYELAIIQMKHIAGTALYNFKKNA